jgi:NAD(P)-dependent dehydrogenase (short-subunit alcohol dehydrogenase family)
MLDPRGKVIMINGANRGIGASFARRFHKEGWIVSLGSRNLPELQSSVLDFKDERVSCHQYDTNDRNTDEQWVSETIEQHGSINALVNNAGVCHPQPLGEVTEEQLDEMWSVNVKAPLRLIQASLPALRSCGTGRIVNVVSLSGKRVKGTFGPGYAMSKHAALALHHAVRHSEFDSGIRVTAICPGYVATDMTAQFGVDASIMIDPDDLAETVATLVRLPNTAAVAEILMTCEPEVIG